MLATAALRSGLHGAFRLPCSFYRGGTSKGLLWSTSTLARFDNVTRDRLICHAMGSPDPDKRQIDGLGGGISSLSKTAIVGPPDAALAARLTNANSSFADGVHYADDEALAADAHTGWDLVYRFGQVPVHHTTHIDWSSTCANLVSAVALFGLHQAHVPQSRIHHAFERQQARNAQVGDMFAFPARLLVSSSGQIVRANVPVTLYSNTTAGSSHPVWYPHLDGHVSISGVPGTAPGILIQTPLDSESLLPTGNQVDTVTVDNTAFPVSIINAGLPTIFIASHSLSSVLDPSQLPCLSPSDLDANFPLMTLLDQLRNTSACLTPFLRKTLSPSAPKICIVHPAPTQGYTTTAGQLVSGDQFDILIRAVSVANIHRTIPATCLSALAAARAFPLSTIEQTIQTNRSHNNHQSQADILSIRVAQPAGVSEASVKLRNATHVEQAKRFTTVPESIVYYRTARRIIDGFVDVPCSFVRS